MKYTYAYKTSDGTRHEATMNAESREAVFAALRAKGVKAIKVVAADGAKANGEIRGVSKRFVAIATAVAAAFAGLVVFLAMRGLDADVDLPENAARPLPRQEIPGDRKRLEQLPDDIFSSPVDAFLARFAEPGRPYSAPEVEWPSREACEAAFQRPLMVRDNELTEHVDVKRIVEGMKRELRMYLRLGGYVSGYVRELIRRQDVEIGYREKAEKRLNELLAQPMSGDASARNRAAYDFWVKANAQLHSMGIYAIPQPRQLKGIGSDLDLDE